MKDLLQNLDRLIRDGRGAEARRRLTHLGGTLPRKHLADLAWLSWRVDLPQLGLRVLHPFVRPAGRSPESASPVERAEYARCLLKLGAVDESLHLLQALDKEECPQAALYLGSALVSVWNYRESIPYFERYITACAAKPYAQAVGKANLAASLIYEGELRRVRPLLRELLYLSSLRGFRLMLGRVLELSAEALILQKKWSEAESFLGEAAARLADSDGIDAFLVRKFQAVVRVGRAGGDNRSLEELEAVRVEAMARCHWETVRDCDRIAAIARQDQRLLAKLFFGTPYATYRERLLTDFQPIPEPPDTFRWELRPGRAHTPVFDLLRGRMVSGSGRLVVGSLLHRTIVALSSDFYRPHAVAALYGRLYPERRYNPSSSPSMVQEAIRRLRLWCSQNGIPLEVKYGPGGYRLHPRSAFSIRVCRNQGLGQRYGLRLDEIHRAFRGTAFSVREVMTRLGIPRRTAVRILRDGVTRDELQRKGEKRGTRYTFRKPA